ncbi:MAG: BTAD domain-containing putative transcriptional regulator [Gemmatimonadota bacterium]
MSPAVELLTLGSTRLRRSDGGQTGETLRVQPKHLGVLVFLAAEADLQFRRRDVLLATFWPELDTRRARNALNQALYRLRETVGRDAIPSRGNEEVGVSRDVLACDAVTFENAVEDERLDDALDLYRGPFLDGFHLSGVPRFERWMDGRRERLRRAAHRCARELGDRLASEGAILEAARSLERAIEIAPTREDPVRQLMKLLHGSGDRAAALRAYRRFEHRLQEDFGLEPSDRTRNLARSLEETASAPSGPTRSPAEVRSVALLPFRNLGEESADAYFLEGMADALLTELGRVDGLRVTSPRPRHSLSSGDRSAGELARHLGVDAVLEGGVLREEDRVRISARLVQARPESHLWSESFVRDVEDMLALHHELATAIAREVAGALTEETRPSDDAPRIDPAAYDMYLRGRFFTKNVTEMPRGIEMLRQAIEADPTFAPAYAEIALCHCNLAALCYLPPSETAEKVDAWVERALELDPGQAEAHTARGFARTLFHRDWDSAEADFRRGVELNPTSVDCQSYFTFHLTSVGAWAEGLRHVRRALELDPLEPGVNWADGWTLHKARRWEPSTRALERTRELYPSYALLYPFLAANHARLGEEVKARDALQQGLELAPDDQLALGYGAAVLAMLGDDEGARELTARLDELGEERYLDPYYRAVAAGALGNTDRAFQLLHEMCDGPSASGFNVFVDPLLDPVRDDPRFDDILERLALPPPGG